MKVTYLNTSYVKVQQNAFKQIWDGIKNLNTSYVKVQQSQARLYQRMGTYLNTSYVKVQLDEVEFLDKAQQAFKYILC